MVETLRKLVESTDIENSNVIVIAVIHDDGNSSTRDEQKRPFSAKRKTPHVILKQ
jgi:hypothetical protein